MPTNTVATTARRYQTSQTHYLRKNVAFGDASPVTVGIIPAGAVVIDAGVVVTTAFNGTTPTAAIGTSGSPTGYGTGIVLSAQGKIASSGLATSTVLAPAADTTVTATLTLSGASAGAGVVYVQYMVDNG